MYVLDLHRVIFLMNDTSQKQNTNNDKIAMKQNKGFSDQ